MLFKEQKCLKGVIVADVYMKDVPGFEGQYAATLDGHIWSYRLNRFLKETSSTKYYLSVRLNGKTELIHRLIAKTYLDNYHNYPTVDQINRIKTDNRVVNLRWASYSMQNKNKENGYDSMSQQEKQMRIQRCRQLGKKYGPINAYCLDWKGQKAKKPVVAIDPNTNKVVKEFGSAQDACAWLGNKGGYVDISRCCNGRKEIYRGYKWKFAG